MSQRHSSVPPENSQWSRHALREIISTPVSGFSVISDDVPACCGEIGVLKLSALSDGVLYPDENKRVQHNQLSRLKTPVRKGTLLISRSNTPDLVGAVAYVPDDFPNIYLSDLLWECSLINHETHDMRWLTYLLASPQYRRKIIDCSQGTSGSMKKITKAAFLKLRILGPPFPQQLTIVSVLSSWDQAIEQTERLIAAKRRRKQALMQQLLTGKRRLPEFVGEPWRGVRLGEIFRERCEADRGDLPLLSITADRGVIPRAELEKKDTSNEDKRLYKRIAIGDIGYNTMRMWQGVSALSGHEGIISPAYTVCIPGPEILGTYAAHLFKHLPVVHLFRRYSQGLVDDTLNLKFKHFAEIRIALPCPEEQRRIAEVLSACDEELRRLDAQLDALKRQKRGLMQQLLTGKVRVPMEEDA